VKAVLSENMSNGSLCSFSHPHTHVDDSNLTSIVNVLLGLSESEVDVTVALEIGPINFITYIAGTSFASLVAEAICRRADDGHSTIPVEQDDVRALIEHYLKARFQTSSATRIGIHGAYNFQRLIYNISACVVAYYDRPDLSNTEHLASLRRAVLIVAAFSDAVKNLQPVSPFVGNWWTSWHVLAYAIEMTTGTVLSQDSRSQSLAFSVFCDTIMANVLQEWDGSSAIEYKSSSFAWCACSNAWQRTLGSHPHLKYTPNSVAFLSASSNILNPPDVEVVARTRPASPSAKTAGHAKRNYESPLASRVATARVASRVFGPMDGTKRSIAL